MSGWRRVGLDELPDLPGPGTLRWRPVRSTLDLHAFGANAYTASEAGADIVEPHVEEEHEELYFVHSGAARFTLDGETFDAPAGTYVAVTDPGVHRHAVALEAGTTLLSFGGPPSFAPSRWEWTFRATGLRAQGDVEGASRALAEAAERFPADGAVPYELACLEASQGRFEEAEAALRHAVALQPETAQWALEDDELAPLRQAAERTNGE